MNSTEFNKVVNQLNEIADRIVSQKRPDYTRQSSDVLANFKESAEQAGITPLQAWLIHFHKQYTAIARFVANDNCTPSEPIESRFADLRNYLHLGYGLFVEFKDIKDKQEPTSQELAIKEIMSRHL
jgi:hypothetical protein